MVRGILAVVLGLIAGGAATGAVEAMGHFVYPPPTEITEAMAPDKDPAQPISKSERMALLKVGISKLPAGAFVFVLAAWFCGGLLSALAAGYLAAPPRHTVVSLAAAIYWLFCLLNLLVIPGPIWFTGVGLVIPWLGAGAGWRLVAWFAPRAVPS